jgi:hypothetical protein
LKKDKKKTMIFIYFIGNSTKEIGKINSLFTQKDFVILHKVSTIPDFEHKNADVRL